MKDNNVLIDGNKLFEVKNDLRTYDRIQKVETGQGDNYKTILSLFQRTLLANFNGDSNDETNFPNKFLLTNT